MAKIEKGRGALGNPGGRFDRTGRETFDDGWEREEETPAPLHTTVTVEQARTIISRNDSPDIPFDQSINPYRGCEHGCIYCYARPTHAYLGLSPGLDFETRLYAKPDAAALLRRELAKPGYRCSPINLGANTDPYQPVEREWRITRQVIEVLAECEHPLTIVTKSALVERDIDLLAPMTEKRLVQVYVSLPTLDRGLARRLEPRAAAPQRRLQTLRALSAAGIPCGVLVAPIIPALTDAGMETVLAEAQAVGAATAACTLLRLPHEVADLFRAWLEGHYPLRAAHVMSLVQQMRGGRDNDPEFGSRMRGGGEFADLIAQRFRLACRRHRLNERDTSLDTTRFRAPSATGQLSLF